MRRKVNRLLAALLVFVFSLSLMPEIAFAATPEKFELDFTQVDKNTLYEYKTGAYYLNSTYSAARKDAGTGVKWRVLTDKTSSPILQKSTAVRFFPGNSNVRGMYIMFYNSHIATEQEAAMPVALFCIIL